MVEWKTRARIRRIGRFFVLGTYYTRLNSARLAQHREIHKIGIRSRTQRKHYYGNVSTHLSWWRVAERLTRRGASPLASRGWWLASLFTSVLDGQRRWERRRTATSRVHRFVIRPTRLPFDDSFIDHYELTAFRINPLSNLTRIRVSRDDNEIERYNFVINTYRPTSASFFT